MGAAEKLTRMDGECDDDLFWSEVAFVGWGERGYDHHARKSELLGRWTPAFARSFSTVWGRLAGILDAAITRWESDSGKKLECGDDGYGDLKGHIIGRGKKMYEAALADPSIAYEASCNGSYVESFSYCIPHGGKEGAELTEWEKEDITDPDEIAAILKRKRIGDWVKVDIEHYVRWAQESLDGYRAALANDLSGPITAELELAISVLRPLAEEGKYVDLFEKGEDLARAIERINDHGKILKDRVAEFNEDLPYWSMKNMLSDIGRYLK